MNILMLGWEYPPHITGGLGTACHGLLRGLRQIGSCNVAFVVPRLSGGEDDSVATLISAENLPERSLCARSTDISEVAWLRKYIGACAGSPPSHKSPAIAGGNMSGGGYQGHSISGAIVYENRASAIEDEAGPFDLIHAHDWLTFLAGVRLKRKSGRPLIAHVHSTELDRSGAFFNQNIFGVEKFGMQEADLVVAVSGYTRRVIVQRYGINPDKVIVIHNACEHEGVNTDQPSGGRLVSFIGRITSQKGPRHFVEAAAMVLKKIPDANFVMAGDGDLLPLMKALVSMKGLADRFSFPGFLDQIGVRSLLRQSNVYVMPSESEPFGIGALEAIHAGVPVVLSKNCGVSEMIRSAPQVDPTEGTVLADAIVELLTQPLLATQRVAMAREEARVHTWKDAAVSLTNSYREILMGGRDDSYESKKAREPIWSE